MDRDIMDLYPDPALLERLEDGAPRAAEPLLVEPQRIEVVRGAEAGRLGRRHHRRQIGERAVVARGDLPPALDEARQLGELRATERALQIGDAVVPAELDHLVVPGAFARPALGGVLGDAVAAQAQQAAIERLAAGGDGA